MITNKELNISNKSYVNKSFADIYPELVSSVSTISNRWNVDSTNESDPGLVLLKEAAAIADKNNYNIDKNVLECFMSSATQETSMRNLCEMNGYQMKYYQAASVDVSFLFKDEITNAFTLPKFNTVVSTEDGSVKYTLIQDRQISDRNVTFTATALEGTIETLMVGDSSVVQLNNLDDDNRIYFPDLNVAENGIFVLEQDGFDEWVKVDYLHLQDLGLKVFKFGFDSKRELPYIEFPTDIASLIGTGLTIKYIATSGEVGNVPSGVLTVLVSPDVVVDSAGVTINDLKTKLQVGNNYNSTNGRDPESIESAYSNYKRSVATFDTLVTCRDYANYIYNAKDPQSNNYIVSNVQAADRRTDYNYSNNIQSYKVGSGSYIVPNSNKDEITAFDLCLYPLAPMSANYEQDSYDASFKPLGKQILETDPVLADSKCLAHDFKELASDDVYAFKNCYTLDVSISTYDTVDSAAQIDLIKNIKTALYRSFNARNVDFGEEIPVTTIKEVILNSDTRISDVNIGQPTLVTEVMNPAGISTPIADMQSVKQNLVAKNILAGKLALFTFNTHIKVDYGQAVASQLPVQEQAGIYTGIDYAGTEVQIPINELMSSTGYTLKANEILQFVSPNFASINDYGIYVNYRFTTSSNISFIKANSIYRFSGDDELRLVYTDPDTNVTHNILYTATYSKDNGIVKEGRTVIKPSFDLYTFDESALAKTVRTIDFDESHSIDERVPMKFWVLAANETISIVDYVRTRLDNATLPCYWLMNNDQNVLFEKDETQTGDYSIEVTLQNGEYFMYSNTEKTDLVMVGSGTKLKLNNVNNNTFVSWSVPKDALLDIKKINEQGLAAFSSMNWQDKLLSRNPIDITEMSINTFAEGDTVYISKTDTAAPDLNNFTNDQQDLAGYSISAKVVGESSVTNLGDLNIPGDSWLGRSRLDLSILPDKPQQILEHQVISIADNNGIRYDLTGTGSGTDYIGPYIVFDYNVQSIGSARNNLEDGKSQLFKISERIVSGIRVIIADGLTATVTNIIDLKYPSSTSKYSDLPIIKNSDGFLAVNLEGFGASVADSEDAKKLELPVIPVNKQELLMMYYESAEVGSSTVTVTADGSIDLFNRKDKTTEAWDGILSPGINIIVLPADSTTTKIWIDHSLPSSNNLYIGKLNVVDGYNKYIDSSINIDSGDNSVLDIIAEKAMKDSRNIFNYLNQDTKLNFKTAESILSPELLWDKNNIANKFTIAKIEVEKSAFRIV